MFLLDRWKDLFSRSFYKKSENYSGGSSFGFFVFWNLVLCLVLTVLVMGAAMRLSSSLVNKFEDDFLDFRIAFDGENLSVDGLPNPFILSEFLRGDDQGLEELFDDMMIESIREGVDEALWQASVEYNFAGVDFVLDTNGVLFESYEDISEEFAGVYLLKTEFVYVNPNLYEMVQSGEFSLEDLNLPEELKDAPMADFPVKIVTSYSETGMKEFEFDKDLVVNFWQKIDGWIIAGIGLGTFFLMVFLLIVLRSVTNIWWSLISWWIVALMGYKTDFGKVYQANLHLMVLITLIELVLIPVFLFVPFSTFGLVLIFSLIYGSYFLNSNSDVEKKEPESSPIS